MENKVVLYVSSDSVDTNNRVYGEKYEFAFDRKVILNIISQMRKGGTNKISYYDFHGNEVVIADTDEGLNEFVEFVRQKTLKNQRILVLKYDFDVTSRNRFRNNFDFADFVNVFNCEVPAEKKRYVIEKFGPAGTNVFRTDDTVPKRAESTVPANGALVVTRLSNKDTIELLKSQRDSQIFVPVENGDFIQIKFRADFRVSGDGVFQWGKKPEDPAFKCHQVLVPVTLYDGEIIYGTEKSRELMAELGTNFVAENDEAKNFESSDHTYVKSSQDTDKEIEIADQMAKYVRLDSLNEILNAFKTELMEDVMSAITNTFKKCETSDNCSAIASLHKENPKEGAALFDGADSVKSEAEDSEVLKLLHALSTIEERLYAVEDTVRQADKSAKHNKLDYGYYGHCERRIRELNSLAKKTALNMLRKRENGKMVELETDLFVISKSGYKIKMGPNSSTTIRISLLKCGKRKHMTPDMKLELYPSMIPREVECCVKPVFKGLDKLPFQDKNTYTQKDIRFKTKEKTGKFRCYFNVTQGGKIWGNPLRIDVRVKKLYAQQNYLPGDETNSVQAKDSYGWLSKPSTSKSVFDAMPLEYEREQMLRSSRNNDLIDEGIGGNQEGAFSASSDSEDTDANDTKAENVNDEGIDTKFPNAKEFRFDEGTDTKFTDAKVFRFDEDSDSSVSLLLDENEVRDKTDDELEIVKIPPCFLPNTELSQKAISVRVKRKMNEMKTSTITDSSDDQRSQITKQSRSKLSPQKIEESVRNADSAHVRQFPRAEYGDFVTHEVSTSAKNVSKDVPAKKIDSMKCDVADKKESIESQKSTDSNAGKEEVAKDSSYASLYPNLDNVQDFLEKFTSKKENANTSSSPSKDVQPPIVILPEKVIEMTSNVFKTVLNSMKAPSEATYNFQKNFDETLSSLSRVIINSESTESARKESAVTQDAQNSEASNNTSASPTFTSAEGSSPQYTWATSTQSSTTNEASTSTSTSTSKTPVTTDYANFWDSSMTQSTSIPPPKRQFMEADLTPRDQQPPSDPAKVNGTPTSSFEPKQTHKTNEKTELDEKYNELPPSVRSQLLKLNEMGFMNDSYNLFLIKRYPRDLNKVIESLVNYNDL